MISTGCSSPVSAGSAGGPGKHTEILDAIQTFRIPLASNAAMGDFAGNMVGTLQFRRFPDGSDSDTEAAVAAAVRGDLAAFETIYRQFAPRIYGLCLRLTGQREAAEDCTQESFVAAWRSLGRFEKRSLFSTWLQRIAIRTVLARRRGLRASREVGEPAEGLPDRPDHGMPRRRSTSSAPSRRCRTARATCWFWSAFTATATARRRARSAWRKAPARLNCTARAVC